MEGALRTYIPKPCNGPNGPKGFSPKIINKTKKLVNVWWRHQQRMHFVRSLPLGSINVALIFPIRSSLTISNSFSPLPSCSIRSPPEGDKTSPMSRVSPCEKVHSEGCWERGYVLPILMRQNHIDWYTVCRTGKETPIHRILKGSDLSSQEKVNWEQFLWAHREKGLHPFYLTINAAFCQRISQKLCSFWGRNCISYGAGSSFSLLINPWPCISQGRNIRNTGE